MSSRSTGSDKSSPKSRSTGSIASPLQVPHPMLGVLDQIFANYTKQIGEAFQNIGPAQAKPTLSLQGISGVRPLGRMFLHLTARQLTVHADGDQYGAVAEFFSSYVMLFLAFFVPILEAPKRIRIFTVPLQAPFRPCAAHEPFVFVH